MTVDPLELDAVGLAGAIRGGELTPSEAVAWSAARIEALNPSLNAVIHPRMDRALEEAGADLPEGLFRGVPMVLKDLGAASAGDPRHDGMAAARDAGWTEREDSELVAAFRRAGFVILGRTNTPELGLLPTTEPAAHGPSRNPWDRTRSTGGSSGGSAAAVVSGMVPVGHAGDSGGSIRIPASECGLVGLKPTRGLTPPADPADTAMATQHVVTRSVRDAGAVLDALSGSAGFLEAALTPERLSPVRVGIAVAAPGGFVPTHPGCEAAAREVARRLESLGHHVEADAPPAWTDPDAGARFLRGLGAVFGEEAADRLDRWGERLGRPLGADDVETHTWTLAEMGRSLPEGARAGAREDLDAYARDLLGWWRDHDLLVTPTIAEPPPPLGEFASSPEDPLAAGLRAGRLTPYTTPFNVTGQPAMSVPAAWNEDGLPIGVQLIARPGEDDVLIRIAAQLEAAGDWSARRPPLD